MSKLINTRISQKHDFECNWDSESTSIIPLSGEVIIYDSEVNGNGDTIATLPSGRTNPYNYARVKIGDGIHLPKDLPFVTDKVIVDITDLQANNREADVYRLTKGVFLQSGMKMYGSDCIVTDTQPLDSDVGECFIRISPEGEITFAGHYVTKDNNVWCYLDTDKMTEQLNASNLSGSDKYSLRAVIATLKGLTTSTKWQKIEDVSNSISSLGSLKGSVLSWGGVIKSIDNLPNSTEAELNKTYLYVYEELYSYRGSSWVSDEQQIIPGSKPGAEIFNNVFNVAEGIAAHAEGNMTSATGKGAHTEGSATIAEGDGAHAEGTQTAARGNGAHAEGEQTNALAKWSHAEGYKTEASAQDSHAEGSLTVAGGAHSHAEGYKTEALGSASHASGIGTIAQGDYQTAVGRYNVVDSKSAFIIGNGGLDGQNEIRSNALTVDWEGNANFRGKVTTGGKEVLTKSDYVTAGRKSETSVGEASTAEGALTTASGVGAHAEGGETQATGPWAHSEGYGSRAIGNSAHAQGVNTLAIGHYSHAEGFSTSKYIVESPTKQDFSTTGPGSFTVAAGTSSHAEGHGSIAYGDYSHAEGTSRAAGEYAHSEGHLTQASGTASHASGYKTKATGNYQTVIGRINKEDNSQAFIIGGGTTPTSGPTAGVDVPINIATVDWEGNAEFAGTVKVSKDKEVATQEYVTSQINKLDAPEVAGDGLTFIQKISESDGVISATKSNIQAASTSQSGVVQLSNEAGTSTSTAATPKALKDAIDALDVSAPALTDASTLTVISDITQTNGKISATKKSIQKGTTEQAGVVQLVDAINSTSKTTAATANAVKQVNDKILALDFTAPSTTNDSGLEFISTVSQTDGKISATKIKVKNGSTSQMGVVKLADESSDDTTTAATPNAIKKAIESLKFTDPTASGTSTSFISSVSQTDGKITATKANLPEASTSDKGIVRLNDTIKSTLKTQAATANAVKTAYDTACSTHYITTGRKEGTTAGQYSTAEGYDTTASGKYSHAEGSLTKATADYAHAEGYETEANGLASHASGKGTIAQGSYQTAIGQYNVRDFTSAFIIGNGTTSTNIETGESIEQRSNAHTLAWTGNAWHRGDVKVGGTSYNDSNAKTLATQDYVIDRINELDVTEVGSTDGITFIQRISETDGKISATPSAIRNATTSITGVVKLYDNLDSTSTFLAATANAVKTAYDTACSDHYITTGRKAETLAAKYSTAEGYNTTASAFYTHAEGYESIASNSAAHSEGDNTRALGNSSHTEGRRVVAMGSYSHAEGQSTNHIDTSITVNSTVADIVTSWNSNKFAIAKGQDSHIEGVDNIAWGAHSHSEGESSRVFGTSAHAEGYQTCAFGNYSHAEGGGALGYTYADIASKEVALSKYSSVKFAIAYGAYSHIEGQGCFAVGENSHAEGYQTKAVGNGSHAEGTMTTASDGGDHAEGSLTSASGGSSHAEGGSTTALGNCAHAEGWKTTASGGYAHAEGMSTTVISADILKEKENGNIVTAHNNLQDYEKFSLAKGVGSHVEGVDCLALGKATHAEGCACIAWGNYSHAEGKGTTAYGTASHASGYHTYAGSSYQTVIGKYNSMDLTGEYAFIIGNGDSYTPEGLSNALTVDWDGNLVVKGNISAQAGSTKIDLVAKIKALETNIGTLQTQLTAANLKITSMGNRLDELEGKIK